MASPDKSPVVEINVAEAAPVAVIDPVAAFRKVLWKAWHDATDRETPTLHQLIEQGVKRVDVDATAGYIAVVMSGDTHRAIGVRRDLVSPLVAALTGRTSDEVLKLIGKGPAKIESRAAQVAEEPVAESSEVEDAEEPVDAGSD